MTGNRLFLLLAIVAPLVGCDSWYVEESRKDPWHTIKSHAWADRKATDDAAAAGGGGPAGESKSGYAILLESFSGPKAEGRARAVVKRLEDELHVPDLWVQNINSQTNVYRGHYPHESDPLATQDLRQTRMLKVDDARPYASVNLVSLDAGTTLARTPLDLHQPQFDGMYTLQIGFYDNPSNPARRKAAEQAATALRADGVEAYFYHGPNRSLVCVGLFNEEDFERSADGMSMQYGPRVRDLQKKYPNNLGNGMTVVEHGNGREAVQPSFLVRIY